MKIFVLEYFYERGGRRVTRIFSDLETAFEALEFGCKLEPVNSGSIKRYENGIDNEFMEKSKLYRVEFGKIIKCKK